MRRWVLLLGIAANAASSQDISRDLPYVSVDIRTPLIAPQTAGGYLLQYEIFVTNWYDKEIALRAVDMLAGDVLLTSLQGQALDRSFAPWDGQNAVLQPRQTTTILLSGVANELPPKLDHRIRFRVAGDLQDTVIRYPGTPVHKNLLRLRPPLRGGSGKQ